MVFKTTADLKNSPTFRALEGLSKFSERQLVRFQEIYNAAYQRVVDGGGDEKQAEATAVAIAYPAARRAHASTRVLESEVHYFAAMAPQQLGGSALEGIQGRVLDFAWVKEHPDLASLAVAGNEFNDDHDQSKGVGQIRGLVLRDAAPVSVREKTHPDIPFLYVASYYADAPETIKKTETISAEWAVLGETDGIETPLPLSFAVTPVPLNDATAGIKRIASLNPIGAREQELIFASLAHVRTGSPPNGTKSEMHKKSPPASDKLRPHMPTPAELAEQLAAQQDREKRLREAFASLRKTVAAHPTLVGLTEVMASLDKDDADLVKVVKSIDTHFAGLVTLTKTQDESIASLRTKVDTLEQNQRKKAAEEFVASLITDGAIPTSEAASWTESYLKDEKMAGLLAKSLQKGVYLGKNAGKGESRQTEVAAGLDAMLESFDPNLKKTVKAGGA